MIESAEITIFGIPGFVLKSPGGVPRHRSLCNASKLDPVDCAERPRSNRLSRAPRFWFLGPSLLRDQPRAGRSGNHDHHLISGQYDNPVRVVAFNTAEGWSQDVSEDIAREIMRRVDLAGDELSPPVAEFVGEHVGPDRQLTLRLA